jgi:hypothetical protein
MLEPLYRLQRNIEWTGMLWLHWPRCLERSSSPSSWTLSKTQSSCIVLAFLAATVEVAMLSQELRPEPDKLATGMERPD